MSGVHREQPLSVGVVPDEIAVQLPGGFPEIWFGVELIPGGKPLLRGVRFPRRRRNAAFPSPPFPSRSRHWSRNWAFLCWNDRSGKTGAHPATIDRCSPSLQTCPAIPPKKSTAHTGYPGAGAPLPLQKVSAFISVYEVLKDQITDSCKNLMWELLPDALEAHRQIITEGPSSLQHRPSITIPPFHAERRNDVILLSRLLEYPSAINQYAAPPLEGCPSS